MLIRFFAPLCPGTPSLLLNQANSGACDSECARKHTAVNSICHEGPGANSCNTRLMPRTPPIERSPRLAKVLRDPYRPPHAVVSDRPTILSPTDGVPDSTCSVVGRCWCTRRLATSCAATRLSIPHLSCRGVLGPSHAAGQRVLPNATTYRLLLRPMPICGALARWPSLERARPWFDRFEPCFGKPGRL